MNTLTNRYLRQNDHYQLSIGQKRPSWCYGCQKASYKPGNIIPRAFANKTNEGAIMLITRTKTVLYGLTQ